MFRRRIAAHNLPASARAGAIGLSQQGLTTPSAVWKELARTEWALDPVLAAINERRRSEQLGSDLTAPELAEAIAALAGRDQQLTTPWPHRASQALLWLLLPVILLVAWQNRRVPWPITTVTTLSATRALAAYHVIEEKDLREVTAEVGVEAAARMRPLRAAAVVGRFATRAIGVGEAIRIELLKDARRVPDLAGRAIVTLPARPVDATLGAELPASVTLVFADAEGKMSEYPGVYLLALGAIDRGVSPATLALTAPARANLPES